MAKLADFGLARMQSGGLKMGLDAWQWNAPEVMDGRKAATFTVQADVSECVCVSVNVCKLCVVSVCARDVLRV